MAKHPIYRRWRSWGAAAGVACASTILIPGATARPTALPQQSGHVDLLTQANLQIPGAMTGEWAGTWVAAAGDVLGDGGFRIDGAAAYDHAGYPVAGVGDVNGDGRPDVMLGATQADNNQRTDSGSGYVVFGKSTSTTVDLATLGNGGFRIDGGAADDPAGQPAAGAAD